MRILTHTVSSADEGRAVRSVVPRRFSLGQHAFRRLKVLEAILVNGQTARADCILHEGDIIEIHLPSDVRIDGETQICTDGESLPPSFIRYQDEDILIVAKGAPLPTLPARHIVTSTLREQLIDLLHADPASFVYHPLNRLDKGTSGLMVVARTPHAQHCLQKLLHTPDFHRGYLAVTEGVPSPTQGVIDLPIAKADGATVRREVCADGKEARTFYRVLQKGARSLVRLKLDTGRTHQIRVHMAHHGCPVTGDFLYGTEITELPGRFALHSAMITITHPVSGEKLTLESQLPEQLNSLLHG